MRLLLDVNVGTRIAEALTNAGHDVERMVSVDALAEDVAILLRATATQRVLVTCDRDFGELVFTHAVRPLGVVYLRFRARDVELAIARLVPVLDMPQVAHHMTVIDDRRVRQTPLPERSERNG